MNEKLARLTKMNPNNYSWPVRTLFALQRRRFGEILNPMFCWGRSTPLAWAMALFFASIDRRSSPIEKELRAILTVRVSQVNHCEFCTDLNSMFLLERSESGAKLEDLMKWRESKLFSKREQSALAYAEAMTDSHLEVSDAIFSSLKDHFSEVEIVELTGLIAYQNLSSKFNNALDIRPQGFCRSPSKV